MTRVAVTVIGTNLVMDYGTEEAAREAMDSMAAHEAAPFDMPYSNVGNHPHHRTWRCRFDGPHEGRCQPMLLIGYPDPKGATSPAAHICAVTLSDGTMVQLQDAADLIEQHINEAASPATLESEPRTKRGRKLLEDISHLVGPNQWTGFREEQVSLSIAAIEAEAASPAALDVLEAARAVADYSWGLHLAGTPNEAEAIALIETLRARLTEQETDDDDGSLGWDMGGSEPGPAYRAAPLDQCNCACMECGGLDGIHCLQCASADRPATEPQYRPRRERDEAAEAAQGAAPLVYLPIDCPICGRHRVEWDGKVLRCEKCTTSSEWDGFSKERYQEAAPLDLLRDLVQHWDAGDIDHDYDAISGAFDAARNMIRTTIGLSGEHRHPEEAASPAALDATAQAENMIEQLSDLLADDPTYDHDGAVALIAGALAEAYGKGWADRADEFSDEDWEAAPRAEGPPEGHVVGDRFVSDESFDAAIPAAPRAEGDECTTPKWCAENGCQHRMSLIELLRVESRLGEDGYRLVPLDDAIRAVNAAGAAPRAEGPTDHVTDLDDPLACWCGPYRDTEEPNVIIHRKEAEA